ncbi:MAG: 30S ribosomal protein S20 [Candidatus Woesearchaeota archaeon]
MPIIKSAKKAMRQTKKRTEENKGVKAEIKKALKDAINAIENNTKDVAEKIKAVQKKLDKAAKKNIFHPNKVARKLSRLVKKTKTTKK